MARLAIAGIGAGYFSRFHLEGWQDVAGAEVVAWCDLNEDKARAMAGEFGVPRTFADAAAMLDACKPDLVDIVTPPPSHAALAALAHARGIPVICQKPMTPSWAESAAMADAAGKAGVLCVIHENFRFQPWYREAKRLLTSGALGTPHGVAFRLRPGDGQGPRAYLDRQPYFQQMSRLLIVETAIHWIDTFRYLLGEVEAVTARLRRMNPVIAGEDAGILIFEFAGGETGLFDGNRLNDHVAANPRRTMGEMWLEGSAGVLRLDGDSRLWWKPHQGEAREHAYDRGPETFGGGCCGALQRHVVAHLTAGAAIENTASDYLANLRVQEAVYASHATGRRVALRGYEPPATATSFLP
jgi:predicted dehydrogenase